MSPSGNSTHREFAVDPKTFRAKATGIGKTQTASLYTGAARAQRVIDSAPEHCRSAIPVAEGYPEPTPPLPTYAVTSTRASTRY